MSTTHLTQTIESQGRNSTHETSLLIEGMTCGSCVARVDKALRSVPGVSDAAVNLTTGMASVKGSADAEQLIQAVDRAGYSGTLLAAGESSAQTLRDVSAKGAAREQAVRNRLIIGTLAGIPVILIELFQTQWMHLHTLAEFLAISQLLLATIVMLSAGAPFFTGAWRAVRHFSANMDVLVALGTGVAYLYSLILQILEWTGRIPAHRYHNELHAAVTIVVLVTLGKYLEAQAKRQASSAVAGLASQSAATATRLLADGTLETVPAERVQIGDSVQVLAHQSIPVDGEVLQGAGSADLSLITGESIPVDIQPGAKLPGGAMLADGRIVLRATSTAAASTVARILDLVNAAQASKTQVQALADRVAAIFVPIVLVLAVGNFGAWILIAGDWQRALVTTIATIVIACPCAMGLATPTAITVALGTAARLGILFTSASALERAPRIGTVLFDKTGTLTKGQLQASGIFGVRRPEDAAELDTTGEITPAAQRALKIAASIAQFSDHPISKSLVASAVRNNFQLSEPEAFTSVAGGGLRGIINGHEYALGSLAFLRTLNVDTSVGDTARESLRKTSVVALAEIAPHGPAIVGVFGLIDVMREDAQETVAMLKKQGMRVGMISGDVEETVETMAESLGIDFVRARVKPEEKATMVHDAHRPEWVGGILQSVAASNHLGWKKSDGVAFVGDGVNDAPALAAADLGIAMAGGADLAKSAGDILLTSNRLTAIPQVLNLSRRTMRIIRQNLFWAFAYNVAAIPLAMLGILPPGLAAAAMMLSSLTVVLNALRLRRT